MGQRGRILTEILGFDGWKVKATFFESSKGERVEPVGGFAVLREASGTPSTTRVVSSTHPSCTTPSTS